ncbi:MAG: NfeD family protein [bacterium]|nr:NfeD family protein [bacterium]
MSAMQLWLIAAIVLFILEIITPGFVLANFAVASLASALSAWFGADTTMQTVVFVVVSLVSFVTLRPLLRRTLYKNKRRTRTGAEALIGRAVKVTETIPLPPGMGLVQIDGDSWRALTLNNRAITPGTIVTVVRVDSSTVIVTDTANSQV